MTTKQKLELTWIDKDQNYKIEPRILVKDENLSYHSKKSYSKKDIFDNKLIFGDNLLALRALEEEYSEKVKCIYIDPPYNAGAGNEKYEDSVEHSTWLTNMKKRLTILKNLLSNDGLIFVQIDDYEVAYLTVLLDEIFGRNSKVNTIVVKMSEVSGVKMAHTEKKLPKLKEYILVYKKKNVPKLNIEELSITNWNEEYKTILLGLTHSEITEIKSICSKKDSSQNDINQINKILIKARTQSLINFFKENKINDNEQKQFKFDNAWRIIQAVGSSSVLNLAKKQKIINQVIGCALSPTGIIYLYKTDFDLTNKQPRIQIIFADQNLLKNPGDLWLDIKTTGGVGQEGNVLFSNGKKPEALIKRIITMCTDPGDLVLDSFAGSGTTGAVAHKLKRKWIMIEMLDHCKTHIIPRLIRIINNQDKTGITESVKWTGGGGFNFYNLAPSFLKKDKWNNWIINKEYNADMIVAAVCKLEGFTYSPSEIEWWSHGYSTENDFIYITTQTLTEEQLIVLSEEVGKKRTLLIYCYAFKLSENILNEQLTNLTIKKIPNSLLLKYEWGNDDYKINISNLSVEEFKEKSNSKNEYNLFSKNDEKH